LALILLCGIVIPAISTFRSTIPVGHELAAPEALLEFMLELDIVQSEALTGGHAGLALDFDNALSLDRQREPMTSKLAALLARHAGLDWDEPSAVIRHLLRYRPEFSCARCSKPSARSPHTPDPSSLRAVRRRR
jgi:hypothetical protein